MTTPDKKPTQSMITTVSVKKAEDTERLIVNGAEAFPDDPFTGLYTDSADKGVVSIISPTFNPGVLLALTTTNNTLAQCIEVMRVNIDGTGHIIEHVEDEPENESDKQALVDFFDEPYPGKSMLTIRTELRKDLESTGNGYLEPIRNAADEVVLLNQLPSLDMRLVRFDEPVMVTKVVTRKGREIQVKIRARERRYVQSVNGKKVFFKEFGASRDLDRGTGKWAPPGTRLPMAKRSSEIIHYTVAKDAKSPYGNPRWINQLPSILGSRKAEEFNLEFFDAGGLPPVMIVVQGGYLGSGVKEDLQAHLGGKGNKHRAAIVEAISSSGSLDSAGSVKVTVERFGAERQQDSMFQQYDKNSEEHVRAAFRLPPLFVGKAQDYNFATAMTGYMTAEAQVFAPERLEFDESMWWLTKSLGITNYVYKSKPMNLKNIDVQLKAIGMLLDKGIVEPEDIVKHLNAALSMTLTFKEPPPPPTMTPGQNPDGTPADPEMPAKEPATGLPKPAGSDASAVNQQVVAKTPATKHDRTLQLIDLAEKYAEVLKVKACTLSESQQLAVKEEVHSLSEDERRILNQVLAHRSLVEVGSERLGLDELCGALSTV